MSDHRQLTRNYLSLAGAKFISKLLSFAAAVVAARYLGAAAFGVFTFSFAAATLAVVAFQMGITPLVVRDVARDKASAGDYLTTSLLVRFTGTALIAAVALAVYALTASPAARATALAVTTLIFITLSTSCVDIFQAFEKMHYSAAINVINNTLLLAFVAAVALRGGTLENVIAAYGLANACAFAVALAICWWRFTPPSFRPRWRNISAFCREAVPFASSALVANVYWRADRVILKMFVNDRAVGIYGAAASMVEGLVMVAGAFREAVYPALSRYWPSALGSFRDVSRTAFKFLGALALPIGVGTSLVAYKLFPFIYGGGYNAGWPVLAVLIWALVAIFLRELTAGTLFALNLPNAVFASNALGAGASVLLNFVLIPRFSFMGAALAGVVTAFATTAFNVIVIGTRVPRTYPWTLLLRPAVASAAMAGAVAGTLTLKWPLWANVSAGMVVYAAVIVATGYYRPGQLFELLHPSTGNVPK